MTHLDLFSGIGGFAYAADQVWPDVEHTFCEIDPFCQEVLKKHWPNSKIYGDIRSIITDSLSSNGGRKADGPNTDQGRPASSDRTESLQPQDWQTRPNNSQSGLDLITGGFPCQPFSQAGRRGGTSDNRYLWPEMLRVIQLTTPTWVIAENVRGLLTIEQGLVFEQVCLDLEASGYEVQPLIIPAVSLNAPHRRDRVWFIAHAKSAGTRGDGRETANQGRGTSEDRGESLRQIHGQISAGGSTPTDTDATDSRSLSARDTDRRGIQETRQGSTRYSEGSRDWETNWLEVATRLCVLDDGLPNRVAKLKALGNSIVPQVAIEIMKAIQTSESALSYKVDSSS